MKAIKRVVALALSAGVLTMGITSAHATGTTTNVGCASLPAGLLVALCEQMANDIEGIDGGLPLPGVPS
ncbi:MAG: hypothetical protein ACRYG5_15745 [Janthinobacterium lividum]